MQQEEDEDVTFKMQGMQAKPNADPLDEEGLCSCKYFIDCNIVFAWS